MRRERTENGAERTVKFSTALPNWPKACQKLDEALLKTPFFHMQKLCAASE